MPTAPAAASFSQPLVVPRLSIVVLPSANLSNDPDQQYIADGITEDLTTDLSRISGMLVISRNTAFTYRNKPVDTKQISRELGVRYLLEGSVQRSGNRGEPAHRVLKTLVAQVDGKPVCVLVPSDREISMKKGYDSEIRAQPANDARQCGCGARAARRVVRG
jgi:TolB-like protein